MADLKQSGSPNQALYIANGPLEFYDILFTPSAEGAGAADAIDLTMQLVARAGTRPIKKTVAFIIWCGVDGGAVTALAAATMTGLSVPATGILIQTFTASRFLMVSTDPTTGTLIVRVTEAAGAHTRFLFVQMPDGRVVASPQLTWA
jgi:hypothetical protein